LAHVRGETVASLAPSTCWAASEHPLRYCPTPSCDVVYLRPGTDERVSVRELDVEVFHKSRRPDRPVCYCFQHTVRQVERDGSRIVRDIEAKCRDGLAQCETLNPEGHCCLGNVRALMPGGRVAPPSRLGRWATGGAVLAALLSSACCWLPLLLIALGISAGGVAAFFEGQRWLWLGATVGLFGAGFYSIAGRKPVCAPGEACAPKPRRWRDGLMLWIAAVLVAVFTFLPSYAPLSAAPAPAATGAMVRSYDVVGMSCEGCAAPIRQALEKLPGVIAATIVFEQRVARVTFAPGIAPDDAMVLAAIDDAGFEAHITRD
jgi:copper chaperone CopZ